MSKTKQQRAPCKIKILNTKAATVKNVHPNQKGVAEKLKRVASKYGFTTVFTKTKDLRGQLRTKVKNKMETSGVVYEMDCIIV